MHICIRAGTLGSDRAFLDQDALTLATSDSTTQLLDYSEPLLLEGGLKNCGITYIRSLILKHCSTSISEWEGKKKNQNPDLLDEKIISWKLCPFLGKYQDCPCCMHQCPLRQRTGRFTVATPAAATPSRFHPSSCNSHSFQQYCDKWYLTTKHTVQLILQQCFTPPQIQIYLLRIKILTVWR